MASKFRVTGSIEERYGVAPNHAVEVLFKQTDDDDFVLVGFQLRANADSIWTMRLTYVRIGDDGKLNHDEELTVKRGREPNAQAEIPYRCFDRQELIVGVGFRIASSHVRTGLVHTRKLDPDSGKLIEPEAYPIGLEPGVELEAEGFPETELESTVLRGMALRCNNNSMQTMRLYFGKIESRV